MPCPTCQKPAVQDYRPFCSIRCKQVDLGRWFTESYTISSPILPDEEAQEQE